MGGPLRRAVYRHGHPAATRGTSGRRKRASGLWRYDARVLAVLCVAAFLGILSTIAVGPFLPAMAAEFGVPVGVLGQVPAGTMLLGAALGLAIGPLADRYGERRVLLTGAAAVVAGACATAAAVAPAMLVITALGSGLARATLLPVTLSAVSGRFDGAAQRQAVGMVSASVSVSAIGGVPVLTAIAAAYGWRASFVAIAAAAAAVMVLLRVVLPPDADRARAGAAGERGSRALAGSWRAQGAIGMLRPYAPLLRAPGARSVQGVILAATLRNCTAWGFLTYLGAFLVQVHRFGPQEIGWAFLASGAGHFSGSLLIGGRISPAGGPPLRAVFAVLHLVSGALFGAAFVLPLPALGVIPIFVAAACVTGAADVVTTRLLIAETPAGRATTLTLNGSGSSLGGAIGGSLGGVLLSLAGFGAVGAMVFTTGVAAGIVAWLSRTRAASAPLGDAAQALERPVPQTA